MGTGMGKFFVPINYMCMGMILLYHAQTLPIGIFTCRGPYTIKHAVELPSMLSYKCGREHVYFKELHTCKDSNNILFVAISCITRSIHRKAVESRHTLC
jgi:hypothetical protein